MLEEEFTPTDQHVEQVWETPSHEEIISLTKTHVEAMEITDDDLVWVQAGMQHILLTTIGRKTGTLHKVALPTWKDSNEERVVVASFAGAENHPSWFINLRDTKTNPRVKCRVQTGEFWSEPEILNVEERNLVWQKLCTDRAWYQNYQAKTVREIPLVRLPVTETI